MAAKGESPESTDPFDEMEWLVESSLPLVFSTYDDAVRERVCEPVVLLIDCDDEIGREIAEAWLGREAVEDGMLAVQVKQEGISPELSYTTVFARPMPLSECRREVPPVFPYLTGAFDQNPPDGVHVMVVAAGGAATFTVPFSSRP